MAKRKRIIRERIVEIIEEDGRRTRRKFVHRRPQPRIEQKPVPQPMSTVGDDGWWPIFVLPIVFFLLCVGGCVVGMSR